MRRSNLLSVHLNPSKSRAKSTSSRKPSRILAVRNGPSHHLLPRNIVDAPLEVTGHILLQIRGMSLYVLSPLEEGKSVEGGDLGWNHSSIGTYTCSCKHTTQPFLFNHKLCNEKEDICTRKAL